MGTVDEDELFCEYSDNDLTLNWVVDTLRKSGVNSKKQVIDRLENASIFELETFKRSIQDMIVWKRMNNDE